MLQYLDDLFDTSGFPPRWHCGIWSDALGWLHIASDVAIFGAYTAIPLVLAFFVLRKPDVPLPRIIWLFVAFIFACGFGHLLEAVIFWHPIYRFTGFWKLGTALISWITVVAVIASMPYALKLPGLARLNEELERSNSELKDLTKRLQDRTERLQMEVAERTKAESNLAEHARELGQFNRLAVGRELRMIELKREVNELARLSGQPDRYPIDSLEDPAREAAEVWESNLPLAANQPPRETG